MKNIKLELVISRLENLKNIPIYREEMNTDVRWWMTKFTKYRLMGGIDDCIEILKGVRP